MNNIINNSMETIKKNFISKVLDNTDNTVSSINFFVIIVTIIGLCLLAIPAAAIIVELWYTHTVSMSWSDIATYIGAVAAMFASVGITKAWTTWANAKYTLTANLANIMTPNNNGYNNFNQFNGGYDNGMQNGYNNMNNISDLVDIDNNDIQPMCMAQIDTSTNFGSYNVFNQENFQTEY